MSTLIRLPNLQTYPSYKLSGIAWLGDVPMHWEMRRLKAVCWLAYGDSLPADARRDGAVLVYGSNGPVGVHIAANTEAPCIVVGRKGSFGKIHFSARPVFAIDTTYYVDERHSTANLTWLSRVLGWLRLDAVTRDSAVPGLSREDAYDRSLPLPPLPEQAAIVCYLDHVDRRIRRYIAAKRRLIALLEEERQAIVNQAVTRGLDPNVRLKPSGVEWLGDVPEHWEVRRLRSLASIGTGGRDTINREDDGKYPFFVRSQSVERINTWSFDGEAVLTAGDGVGVGKVFHYINGKFDYHQRVYKLSNFRHVVGMYFFHYFRSTLRNEVFQGTAKSTVDSLRLPMVQNFPVALPPLPEQHAIVENLEDATVGIDTAIGRARRQIELMEEYRTRLIADVITGKLDVREAATQLPDEDGDHDPIEESAPLADGLPGDLCDIDESVEDSVLEQEVTA